MAEASKDTIYIDVDDDITSIIDKLTSSNKKIVALVLPKRATSLQSIVNMKLLKRSADRSKKNLVLITSEASLLPLAGAVKLHVAKTLQSKPAIPAAPKVPSDDLSVDDEELNSTEENLDQVAESDNLDSSQSAGDLAGDEKITTTPEETIELDNTEVDSDSDKSSSSKESKKDANNKTDKKLKIPNFNQFRNRFIIGGAVFAVLLFLWILTTFVLPTAKIVITTDDVSVNADVSLTLDTAANNLDLEGGIVPAIEKAVKKTDAEKVTATGKKNVGEKATGSVSLKLTNCSQASVTVPEGTTVSNDNLSFVTQKEVTFNSVKIGNACKNDSFPAFTTGTIAVVASKPGDQFNISGGRAFTVSGVSGVTGFDSSAMTGGTNKEVTVVSKDDVAKAQEKLHDKSRDAAIKELKEQFTTESLYGLEETLNAKDPNITSSPAVDDEAEEVTVTSITEYKMLGAKRDDLKQVIVKAAESKIDITKQKISNDGLERAVIKSNQESSTKQKLDIQSTVSTGAGEDQEALKKEIAGKKKGEVRTLITKTPGVKDVKVNYSPFWLVSAPSNPNKIIIEYKQADSDQSNQ